MQICDIDEPGTYVVKTLGDQFTLEVSRGRDDVLWGELSCFITQTIERRWPEKDTRELKIIGTDDRYTCQPVRDFVGEVVFTLQKWGTNDETNTNG